jgi:hypothetical protein
MNMAAPMIDPQPALDLMAAVRRLFPDQEAARRFTKREPEGRRLSIKSETALSIGLFKEVKFNRGRPMALASQDARYD